MLIQRMYQPNDHQTDSLRSLVSLVNQINSLKIRWWSRRNFIVTTQHSEIKTNMFIKWVSESIKITDDLITRSLLWSRFTGEGICSLRPYVRWELFNNCFNFGIYSCFTIWQKFAITADKKTMNSFKANFKIIVYLADLFENSFEKCSSEFQNFSKIWNEVKWIVFTFSTDTFLWFIVINQVFSFSKSCIPSQKHWIV